MNDILTAISTVGFPIAAYLLMWYDKRTTQREMNLAIENNTNAITRMESAISNATTVNGKLHDILKEANLEV